MKAEDYAALYALEEEFWWFAGMRDITAALLDPFCASARDALILDAGCGTGGNLSWLERYAGNGKVIGIDLVADALRFCAAGRHESLVRASATHLPFADSTFDLVTSFDVLVQLAGEAAEQRAISEMFRVLRPGGIAFVRVAAYRWMLSDHDRDLGTQTRYTLDEIAEKLAGAGFAIARRTYANSLLFPVAAVRRLLLKRIGLASKGSDVKPLPPALSWLNRPMTNALRTEASFLKAPKRQLPFGLSAVCIAKKAEH